MLEHPLNQVESRHGEGRVLAPGYQCIHSVFTECQKYKNICLCPLRVSEARRGSQPVLNNNIANYFTSGLLGLFPWLDGEHYGLSGTRGYGRSYIFSVRITIFLANQY